jgi:hypothetical protein
MCQIIEEYATERAAQVTVEFVENAMNNGNMTAKEACHLLGISLKAYKDAKKLLSENEGEH